MELSRRHLAAMGMLALGATSLVGTARAEGSDDTAVKKGVEELRVAILKQDKAKLDALTAAQLSYSHSDARVQNKAEFIDGVMTRKATVKSIEFPDLTVAMAGPNANMRHLYVSESELDGKTNHVKIGVLQVWQKQGSDWKLLARAAFRLPTPA